MVNYVKDDPTCQSDIVFVGNVHLGAFTETDPELLPPATAELVIDILAPYPKYNLVEFKEITMILEIKHPDGVQFVEHSNRNSGFSWGIPSDASWDESTPGAPTSKLRVRWEAGNLVSGEGNGLTHYLGLNGLPSDTAVTLSAVATADVVVATTSSCPLQIEDFHVGESIGGYLS